MHTAVVSKWARRYVLASALYLFIWQVGTLTNLFTRRTAIVVALYGFIFHVIFGKAYTLVPSYFERELAFPHAMGLHLLLATFGTAFLAMETMEPFPEWMGLIGSTSWSIGVAIFLGTLALTLRGNVTGSATGTVEAKATRQPLDRMANVFIPVGLAYLALGSYEMLARHHGLPSVLSAGPVQSTHLLAAGTAALFVFALGFRLFPRFTVTHPPRWLPPIVLLTGAIGPIVLVTTFGGGNGFLLGAILESMAVVGFGVGYWFMFWQSNRRRIGLYGPLCGTLAGIGGVGLGLLFAMGHLEASLMVVHWRLNLLGFLGLTIIGVAFQFYPPGVGEWPGLDNQLAGFTIGVIFGGVFLNIAGVSLGITAVEMGGHVLTTIGALLYCYILLGVLRAR